MFAALCMLVLFQSPAPPELRFEDVAARMAQRSINDACGGMQLFVDAHPRTDDAARGLVWIARLRLDARDRPRARAALDAAALLPTRAGKEAHRLLVAMDLEEGRVDEAIAGAEALSHDDDARVQAGGAALLRAATHRRDQGRAAVACAVLLALDIIIRGARTRRGLWPVPFEVAVAGPILAVLLVVGALRGVAELGPVAALGVAGTALLWARGAHRRERALPGAWRALDAALAVAEAGALAYAVFAAFGVLDKLVLTFTAGPA